jgi:ubiquinone/menaquinone biosynthesis C-methylase UbiE
VRIPSRFDAEAARYERRAALPDDVCRRAAETALAAAGAGAGDLVVEVGAGTGLIGRWFAGHGVRYLGFDLALGMLARFAERRGAAGGGEAVLVQADGDRRWPLADAGVRLFFATRALHLLAVDHAAAEVRRLAHPAGASLLIGRLRHPADGPRERMAEAMRRRLAERGYAPRPGRRREERLLAALAAAGGERIAAWEVGCWEEARSPGRSLADWRSKPGLGGFEPPAAVKHEVLAGVEAWARATFGDLERAWPSPVRFVMEGVRLPPDGG